MIPAPVSEEVPAAEYKLFVREGSPRMYLKNNDDGVYLSPKGIGWFIGGRSYTRDWSEISKVALAIAHIPKNGPIGTCSVTFRDGSALTILSASKWGHSDDERNVEYGRFITDLHRLIPVENRKAMEFGTGFSKARRAVMIVTLIVAGAFFIALPIGIALYARAFEALLIAAAGAAFVWPMLRMTDAAEHVNYAPDQIPPEFYP